MTLFGKELLRIKDVVSNLDKIDKTKAKNGLYYYIYLNEDFLKVEKVSEKDQLGNDHQTLGIKIFIDSYSPISIIRPFGKNSKYCRIRISKSDTDLGAQITFLPETFNEFYKYFKEYLFYFFNLGGDLNKIKKSIITSKEIQKINSENNNKNKLGRNYQITHFMYLDDSNIQNLNLTGISENEQNLLKNINRIIINPTQEDLSELTDFSNTHFRLKPEPGTSYFNLSSEEIKKDIDLIFEKSNVELKYIEKFITYSNLKKLADGINIDPNDQNAIKKFIINLGSGMILHGPPGTGKTHIIDNYIIPIFKKFGYNIRIVKLPEILGSDSSMYINADSRIVKEIFKPAIKLINLNKKPCFIFADEADKVIESGNGSVSMMKNYINKNSYPGLIMCFNTNLEGGIDSGLIERRLDGIEYGYPNFEVSKNIWKLNIKKIFQNENLNNFTEEDYSKLAKLTANNVGLDSIDSFCKVYRSLTKTENNVSIPIKSFIIMYVENTLERIEIRKNELIREYSKNNQMFNQDELKNLQIKFENQKKNVISALKDESIKDLKRKKEKILEGLNKNNSENLYYINYSNLYTLYFKLNVNDLDPIILRKIFEKISFLKNNIEQGKLLFKKNIINEFILELEHAVKFISNYLINLGNKDILLEIPELFGKEINLSELESYYNYFFINFKYFLKNNLPKDLFNILDETSQNNNVVKDLNAQKIIDNFETKINWIELNLKYLDLISKKKEKLTNEEKSLINIYLVQINFIFKNVKLYLKLKNIKLGFFEFRRFKERIKIILNLINRWNCDTYIIPSNYSKVYNLILEIINLKSK